MTHKLIGEIQLTGNKDNFKIVMPESKSIPNKTEWSKYPIWEFNGKRYRPVTQKASENLDNIIKQIQAIGKTKAIKEAKIKPSSLKYAILTTGIEPFTYV